MVSIEGLFLTGMAGLAAAAGKSVIHKYEDAGTLPLIPLHKIGKYGSLQYEGFFVFTKGVAGLTTLGVEPESPANVISSGVLPSLLVGAPAISTTGDVKSFDFESFYFGCTLNTAAVALLSVNQGCTVTVTGYNKEGEGVANQNFKFVPGGLKARMTKATLNRSFTSLDRIEFSTTSVLDVLVVDLMDNLSFKLNY